MTTAATFAAIAVTLYAGHQLADHVLGQTDRQAREKALPGWRGWRACLAHVLLYHVVLTSMLAVAILALGLDLSDAGRRAGIGFSFATHLFIDRRWPVRWLLEHTGSRFFASPEHPLPGVYLADQALHYACLWVAALIMVVV